MYAKKVKHKCDVRGCKSIDTFAISLSKESGNSVIVCKKCLEEALKAIKNYKPDKKKEEKKANPPSLFYHKKADEEKDATITSAPNEEDDAIPDSDTDTGEFGEGTEETFSLDDSKEDASKSTVDETKADEEEKDAKKSSKTGKKADK